MAATNAVENLQRAKIASGFGFLDNTAGFDISQTLIPFSAAGSTYGDAFVVGLLNTLLVSAIGIVLATFLGFTVGIARLSKNWMVAKVAMVYVEVLRNIPLLLQLLFWYIAVLGPLPQPRNSIEMGAGFFLNSRGLFMPRPLYASDAWVIGGRAPHRDRRRRSCSAAGQNAAGADRAAISRRPRQRSGSSSACRSVLGSSSRSSGPTRSPSTCREKGTSTFAAACRSCPNSSHCSSAS